MTLPSFVVIGAAKCGTTSLCDLVGQHPEVFMSTPKEPHYFSRVNDVDRGRAGYESLFADASPFAAVGEGSTSYTHPHRVDIAAPRIREVLPSARLIYMVRDPIRRLESDWRMRVREGRVPDSINEAVSAHPSLVTFGLYWKHLNVYRRLFEDDQILLVFLEDFAEDPMLVLAEVFRHIGVEPGFEPRDPTTPRNAASRARRDRWFASGLRRLPAFRALKDRLPRPAIDLLKRFGTARYDIRVDWDEETLNSVRDILMDDARKLLDFCGKPRDFWMSHRRER